MANISSANGSIILEGNWTQEALDAFEPVLDMWEFYGEYGIQWCGGFTLDKLKAEFYGCGRWSFSGTLDSFDDWTRSWLKDKPERNGKLIHSLTEEQYSNFLKLMKDNDLSIKIDFEDEEEGFGFREHEVGEFISDGERIMYNQISCEEIIPSWNDYDVSEFESVVDYFEECAEDVDRKKIRKWVRENIPPTSQYLEEEGEVDTYGLIASMDETGVNPLPEFYALFSPKGERWEELLYGYEEYYGCKLKPAVLDDSTIDYYNNYDEEDENVNTWDNEPVYQTDEIDTLNIKGKAFVLTGEFQNFDGDRDKIKELIVSKGGRCTREVSGKTNYLVLGDFGEVGTKKVEKAISEKEQGKDIKIITEYDLFRFL